MKTKNLKIWHKLTIYRAIFICAIILGGIILATQAGLLASFYKVKDKAPKPPIVIDEIQYQIDGTLTANLSDAYPFITGSGTFNDPYSLSNRVFNSEYRKILKISNVHDYFIISNLTMNSLYWGSVLRIEHCSNIIFTKNLINGTEIGVDISKCFNISFSENVFTDRAKIALFIALSENVTLINNTFSSSRDGVNLWGCENILFQENFFYNIPLHALFDTNSIGNKYFNNKFFQNRNGLALLWTSDNLIHNNTFEQNQKTAIALYSSTNNEVLSNLIDKSRYGIYFAWSWEDPEGSDKSPGGKNLDNIVRNNTFTNMGLKSFKNFKGQNIIEGNARDANVGALIFIWIGYISLIGIIAYTGTALIKDNLEFRKQIRNYKGSVNQEDRIAQLERELQEIKEDYFNLLNKKDLE